MMKIVREDWGTYWGAKYRVKCFLYNADHTQWQSCHWYIRSHVNSEPLFLKMVAAAVFESNYKTMYDWVDHVSLLSATLARGRDRSWKPDSENVWAAETMTDNGEILCNHKEICEGVCRRPRDSWIWPVDSSPSW